MTDTPRDIIIRDLSWKISEDILLYFDNYQIGSVAPIAALLEKQLMKQYEEGYEEAKYAYEI